MKDTIKIKGARVHNLKNIDLEIPKNKLVVFTGVSGSGKSSLAFDTIYAEGQRRYVESLSTYARQFLGIMEKPDVDLIEGLSPAISIDQKTTSRNPRSTVGTVTEIYDYFRLLFARVGHPHCPVCGREISMQTVDQIVTSAIDLIEETVKDAKKARFFILSPVVRDKKGEFSNLFDNLKAKGFKKVRIDERVFDLSDELVLIKTNKHTIDVIIDRISLSLRDTRSKVFMANLKSRITDSVEQALTLSDGNVIFSEVLDKGLEMPENPKEFKDSLYSQKFACAVDNIQIPEIEPRTFSFNSPHGACPTCSGIGSISKIDPRLVFSEKLTILEGGILPFKTMFEHDTWYSRLVLTVCKKERINPRTEIGTLTKEQRDTILYGTDKQYKVEGTNRFGKMTYIFENFKGVVGELERRYKETSSDYVRTEVEKYMRDVLCNECKGARLSKEALSVTIDGKNISEITAFSITEIINWVEEAKSTFNDKEAEIGKLIIKELQGRLKFLESVGLNYLTLNRAAGTLSGGEAQRIRLASQIGSGLTGVLYVLDEPTIGLHQRDNKRLIDTLKALRDLGNTVVVVEHDREMMEEADHIVDFGPLAGKNGGEIVAEGTLTQLKRNQKSLTGKYLSGKKKIKVASFQSQDLLERGKLKGNNELKIMGCSQFNLKNIDITFPLGKLVVITGVSGSGKSTLLVETLYPALQEKLNSRFRGQVGSYKRMEGDENVDRIILIDQSPIGRTPRSNPATYTKVFDPVRDVFSETREARAYGFKKGRFSFNVKSGRCEACEGQGQVKIEMQFMSDLWVKCDVCAGKRYNAQTLEVTYKGKNISEVLNMTVNEAYEFFHAHPKIVKKLETLKQVGLGYIDLGQPATTLSGGEAQRVKLATELSKRDTGRTIYILDEPTTGLHFADLEKLLNVLKMLVSRGNSVFLIEHNFDVIKNADYIIDLGPEGGDGGGEVIAKGEVKDIKNKKTSYTGRYL